MNELKPCPFCGGKAKFYIKNFPDETFAYCYLVGIYCPECGMTLPTTKYVVKIALGDDGEIKLLNDERSIAIEAWNRRVNNNAISGYCPNCGAKMDGRIKAEK